MMNDDRNAALKSAADPDPVVYEAFLSLCRPVEGRALTWLMERGIPPKVIYALNLRLCGWEYRDIMTAMIRRFGENALLIAGLLKPSTARPGRLIASFWHYYAKEEGFLVIPYIQGGRPVYLTVRPPMAKDGAERRGIARCMSTAAAPPCLYNVDALHDRPERVMICEGEGETWTALSHGWAAVGSPGAKSFKEAWVEGFRGIEDKDGRSGVHLVTAADKDGEEGSRIITGLFRKAGLSIPLSIVLPPGTGVTDFLKDVTEPP